MCPNAMICSTDTCFWIYLSNSKAGHSGKTMSYGVRKIKRHKLCKKLFPFFPSNSLIPKLQLYTAQKKKCIISFGKERKKLKTP